MNAKRSLLVICAAVACVTSTQLVAEPVAFSLRVGPVVGTYKGEVETVETDKTSGTTVVRSGGTNESLYGVQLGARAGRGDFFGDASVEFMRLKFQEEDLDRTDVVLSGGYFLNDTWSVFGGYRIGQQGDGFFNDDTVSESGPFIGAGFGGVKMGATNWNGSLAYNFSETEIPLVDPNTGSKVGEQEFDYPGISLKVGASLAAFPGHSVQLRYQRFNGDETLENATQRASFELTETYLQLSYLYSFAL